MGLINRHVWPVNPIVTLSKNGTYGEITWAPDPNHGQYQFNSGLIGNTVSITVHFEVYRSYAKSAKFHVIIHRWNGTIWEQYLSDEPTVESPPGTNTWIQDSRIYYIPQIDHWPNREISYLDFQLTVAVYIGGGYSDHAGQGSCPHEGPRQTIQHRATFKPPTLGLIKEFLRSIQDFKEDVSAWERRPSLRKHRAHEAIKRKVTR